MENTIACITEACKNLGLNYRYFDKNKNFIVIEEQHYFQLNRTPFNNEAMAALCRDKEHQYECLNQQVQMPKTMGFLDYNTKDHYQKYLRHNSQAAVVEAIEQNFDYPVVVKQNKGALGINVFKCKNREQVKHALNTIFNKQDLHYDYIALAQQCIEVEQEFRVVFFDGEPVLCYERYFGEAEFGAQYWETNEGRAISLENSDLADRVLKEFGPAVSLPGLRYVGLDIVRDKNDQLYLLELNSGPQVNHFIQNNGKEQIIEMYTKVLRKFVGKD